MALNFNANQTSARIQTPDALRGLAALAVCWFHMTHGGKLLPAGYLAEWSSLGHLGVAVFFVISGFVIPWSLRNETAGLGNFGRFLGKRMVRLHPPFVAACLVAIVLNWLSMKAPSYQGTLPEPYLPIAFASLARDSFYLTGFLGQGWIIVVAWTLAIEVQFYLLAGLLAPALSPERRPWMLFGILMLACVVPWIITTPVLVFYFLPLFVAGWGAAWLRMRPADARAWLAVLVALVTAGYRHGWQTALFAAVAFSVIQWLRGTPPCWLLSLGAISYSLYLIHVPLGGRMVNLGMRWAESSLAHLVLVIVATAACLSAAWIFWRLIEWPCHAWSRKLFASEK